MKFNWRWLRFGGWFSVEPEGEKKKSVLRRAKLHLLRVGADLLKVFLILLAVYFASMPFWPLAVPPVPAELKAKYPVPEFQPRGNGEAEKIWFSLYPMPLGIVSNLPPELLQAPLYRLCEALGSGEEVDWTSPEAAELRGWLTQVEPDIHRMAELCMVEDPLDSPVDGSPVTCTQSFRPLIEVIRILPGIHALDGDGNAALKTIQSFSRIGAYHTRSDVLVGWLVGNLLSEMMTRSVVALYARNLIDPTVAQELELIFKEWQENSGTAVRNIRHETLKQNRFRDLVWGKHRPQSSTEKYWFAEDEAKQLVRQIRYLGWVIGNDYRSAREAGKNLRDRMEIEAVIWSDPAIVQPGNAASGLLDFPHLLFRRAFLSAIVTPQMSGFYRKYFMTDAAHRIGHAVAAIGAYMNTHHSLPLSLDEAFAAAGIGTDYQTRFVNQVPEYRRLDASAPDETNTYAFTLTIWGDGGRCDKGGGVSWLIVRNPAFGEESLRCWNWNVSTAGDRSVESQEVRLLGDTSELDPALIPPDDAQLQFLGVPATLLGADLDKIRESEQALRRFRWSEVPLPPRRSRWTE